MHPVVVDAAPRTFPWYEIHLPMLVPDHTMFSLNVCANENCINAKVSMIEERTYHTMLSLDVCTNKNWINAKLSIYPVLVGTYIEVELSMIEDTTYRTMFSLDVGAHKNWINPNFINYSRENFHSVLSPLPYM